MLGAPPSTASARAAAFVLWALAAASAVYWGLKLWAAQPPAALAAAVAAPDPAAAPTVNATAWAQLLAAGTDHTPIAAPTAASRFTLLGVVAQGRQQGAALIAVDGRPPKPFVVGGAVGEGWVLASVQGRRATLVSQGAGAETLSLELPPQKSATR